MNQPQQRGGCRYWIWLAPVGCLGLIGLVIAGGALLVVLVIGAIKSSDVFEQSMAHVQESPALAEALGSPIEAGVPISGSINIKDSSGNIDVAIPISGPKGSGTVRAVATKSAGTWTLTKLEVDGVEGGMDLLNDR